MNKFLKIFTVYNLINVIIAFCYEFAKIPAHTNRYAYLFASILGMFINVFSYVAIVAVLVSMFAVVYYLIKSIRSESRSEAYVYLFLNMINVMSISYFIILAIAQM